MKDKIDFVVTWVDGNDPAWLKEKNAYAPTQIEDARDIRFRDWGLLRYWFRAVEENAPWVNRIFFVTWGHFPKWLNTSHEKIRIVNHRDYIPSEYLPTFNSHVIELNLHRIQELNECFVYFNDDTYLLDQVKPEDFFVKGLPCDCLIENPIAPKTGGFSSILCATVGVINNHFEKKDIVNRNLKKYFNPVYKGLLFRSLCMSQYVNIMGFYNPHISQPHLKSTFAEVWDKEYEELNRTCLNRFRGQNDISPYLFRYWNLCKGKFHPQYPLGRNVKLTENAEKIAKLILNKQYKIMTINDAAGFDDAEVRGAIISNAFQKRYPNKCSFEVN